jgi:large subunit ribosomal protein L15
MVLINQIKPKNKLKSKKRVGRGGKRGTYSGRGMKGQKSRAGAKIKSEKREAILRIPKRRGVGFKNRPSKTKELVVGVNLGVIDRSFRDGEIVSPKTLLKHGIIRKKAGRVPEVKILASGRLTKRIYLVGLDYSKGAKELIEKAGGSIR